MGKFACCLLVFVIRFIRTHFDAKRRWWSWCTRARRRPAMRTRRLGARGSRTPSERGTWARTQTRVRLRRRTRPRRSPSWRTGPRGRRCRPTTGNSRWPLGTWWPPRYPADPPWSPAVLVAVHTPTSASTSSSVGRWSWRSCRLHGGGSRKSEDREKIIIFKEVETSLSLL